VSGGGRHAAARVSHRISTFASPNQTVKGPGARKRPAEAEDRELELVARPEVWGRGTALLRHHRHRFPADIVQQTIWFYLRFT
jgi:hypothetical protein